MNQAFISIDQQKRSKFTAPVLIYAQGCAQYLSLNGEISNPTVSDPQFLKPSIPILVCHAPYTAHRTGIKCESTLDILELFAFVHPTKFCVPTPAGVLKSFGQEVPYDADEIMLSLLDAVDYLFDDLISEANQNPKSRERILSLVSAMGLQGRGWLWTPYIFSALGQTYDYTIPIEARLSYNVWNHLSEWSEHISEPTPQHFPITADEVRARLQTIITQNPSSEARNGQVNYATRLTEGFRPKTDADQPYITLAEAGTGVGKTLGYLAPVTVWTETNNNPVWISTYTKNLQRQIDSEINKIYPDPTVKESKIAVRKGRENYLCLLNFEDQALSSPLMQNAKPAIASGIMARWISATKDGDLSGADFPGWLTNILGIQNTTGLADRRGECIYSACDHYMRCFAEKSIRKASATPIVVANHATVMIQTAMATEQDPLPTRYVFDEGHHLFHAADNVYCTHITGNEGYELRRWLIGPEVGRKSRARGLKKRIEAILPAENEVNDLVYTIINSATKLPPENWLKQLHNDGTKANFEHMIAAMYAQTINRHSDQNSFYSLEILLYPLDDKLAEYMVATITDLNILNTSIQKLISRLRRILSEDIEKYNAEQQKRIDVLILSLEKKTKFELLPWIETLSSISKGEIHNDLVDWIEIDKSERKINDIGIFRHMINPMKSFATSLKSNLHSAIITSATLRDQSTLEDYDLESWQTAIESTGTGFLSETPAHFSIPSPFSYKTQTKIIIVTDINKNDHAQLSAAYRELFLASKGGALGLFTSIQKLKYVHSHIENELASNDITLYSQHTDGIDTGTLVDMFRDDTHSCLLGTDAIRDGVDVPGESLRLIVFDRVPWPRPTILHKARKQVFGLSKYDDRLTRLKIKQAFGRLIRHAHDRGVFVMLDSSFPSRLHSAFPQDVDIQRCGIKDAIEIVKSFLSDDKQ